MPKIKGEKKKNELVRLPYHFKFKKHFKGPCQEWLEMIEAMCNEILGNYTKKEDQLMTAAFGTQPKRRLNRVMVLGVCFVAEDPKKGEHLRKIFS
jgi:hypothetical protein